MENVFENIKNVSENAAEKVENAVENVEKAVEETKAFCSAPPSDGLTPSAAPR